MVYSGNQCLSADLHLQIKDTSYLPLIELSVVITVDYTPPPGFTPGLNEYRAASGLVTVTCTATGGTGYASYQWSSTCRDCPFESATSRSIRRGSVNSGDTGIHTCTATRGGIAGNASIEFNVVGMPAIFIFQYKY